MLAPRAALLGAMALSTSVAQAVTPISPPRPVPIWLRSDGITDACPSVVRPRLPRGGADGFLSLRSGPGTAWPEIARLRRGALMFACQDHHEWMAVIVQPRGGGDCVLPNPDSTRPVRYAGPCRNGWVAARYLETVAG